MPYKSKIQSVEDFNNTLVPIGDCLRGRVMKTTNLSGVVKFICGDTIFFKEHLGETKWHRINYVLNHPDIDIKGKSISQTCGNAWCCSPAHLWLSYDNGKNL